MAVVAGAGHVPPDLAVHQPGGCAAFSIGVPADDDSVSAGAGGTGRIARRAEGSLFGNADARDTVVSGPDGHSDIAAHGHRAFAAAGAGPVWPGRERAPGSFQPGGADGRGPGRGDGGARACRPGQCRPAGRRVSRRRSRQAGGGDFRDSGAGNDGVYPDPGRRKTGGRGDHHDCQRLPGTDWPRGPPVRASEDHDAHHPGPARDPERGGVGGRAASGAD